ncbi:MAG: hypothetical protein AB1427_16455 [Thermodesulfobacteriota bacterium]
MFKSLTKMTFLTYMLSIMSLVLLAIAAAQEKPAMKGWEHGSHYNKFYKANELDSFKGTVEEIKEVVPLPGMSPCIALVVSESKSEKVLVHVAPSWFMDIKKVGLKKGDKVKVRGVWAEINGKDVFMASKITKGENFSVKVRLTKDGTPFWTLNPEQLAKERAAD